MGETSPGTEEDKGQREDSSGLRSPVKLLDQGEGNTCTIYALALALCRHLFLSKGIQIIVTECLGAIKQLEKASEAAREGNNVDDFHGEVLRNMTDQKTGACGTILIQVKETMRLKPDAEHVLVYDQMEGNPDTKHCVYMRQITEKGFLCLNSWGTHDPTPLVEMGREGNCLFFVEANWFPVDMKIKEPRENVSQGPETPKWSTQNVVRVVLVTNVITVSVTFFDR